MLSSQPRQKNQQSESYNGTVMVNGNSVNVVNGKAVVDGEVFRTNRTGSIVVNAKNQVIGRIVNNEFIPADRAFLDRIRKLKETRG